MAQSVILQNISTVYVKTGFFFNSIIAYLLLKTSKRYAIKIMNMLKILHILYSNNNPLEGS